MTTEFEKKKERHASGESTFSNDSVSNYIPTPPDGGYGWVIVFASFINHVIVDGISFTFGVFYMEFVDYFKESKGKTALVGSLLCGTYLLTGPVAGALTNKYGCRAVCITGGLITSAAFILSTFSTNINMLMATYGVLGGIGFGLVYLPSVVSVGFYFEKRRALATGIAVCGAGVGCFVFAPAGRMLLDTFDWKSSMLIISAVVLNSVVCGMLLIPLEPPRKSRKPREKNIVDRLLERAKQGLGRTDSVSSGVCGAGHVNSNALQRIREAKLARERALHTESESESEMGSQPLSVLHGIQNRRIEWQVNGGNSRHNSFSARHAKLDENIVVPTIVINSDSRKSLNGDAKSFISTDYSFDLPTPQNGEVFLKSPRVAALNGSTNGFISPYSNGNQMSISANPIWKGGPVALPAAVMECRRRDLGSSGIHKEDYARPLYRKDIFYSGSVLHIPQFRSQPDVHTYVRSITSIPRELPPHKRSLLWRIFGVSKVARDVLNEMLDVSLLREPLFIIICLGNILGMIGLYVPFVYIAEKAVVVGIPPTSAAFLLSVIGITNTLGRVLAGWLADFKWVNSLLLHNIAVVGAGITCILNMFCVTYPMLCLFAAAFGFFVATWISLSSIILCDLLGVEKLTNAFGLLTLARGSAVIVGPPIAGFVYDATQNLDASFHVGGVMMIIAGLICMSLHLPFFHTQQDLSDDGPAAAGDISIDWDMEKGIKPIPQEQTILGDETRDEEAETGDVMDENEDVDETTAFTPQQSV